MQTMYFIIEAVLGDVNMMSHFRSYVHHVKGSQTHLDVEIEVEVVRPSQNILDFISNAYKGGMSVLRL